MRDYPAYEHDCQKCTFLGGYKYYDLYFCTGPFNKWPTVIARWSSIGPDYYSGLCFSKPYVDIDGEKHDGIDPLVVARERAEARGLLPREVR